MEPKSWLLIVIRSLDRVHTLQVDRRALIILALGGIFLAGALAFFGHEYFTLLGEKASLMEVNRNLAAKISLLERKVEKASQEKTTVKPPPPSVAIEELKMNRRGKRGGLAVSFRLVNVNPEKRLVSGTLAVVAQDENPRAPVYRVIPEMALDKGIPQQPEKGKKFGVEKHKVIEAFFPGYSGEVFKTLTVFVFSDEGKLILEKSAIIPEK